MRRYRLLIGITLAACVATAGAQSFNIDMDTPVGVGHGAPSAAFAGAAWQTGFWNAVDASGPTAPTGLFGLNGTPTDAELTATGGTGSEGGFNNPNLTGDFALLMDDGADVGTPIQYHFIGFQPGRYLIYTYSAKANGVLASLFVGVPGSSTSPQTITGPMPMGNLFTPGTDYCVHDLNLTGDSFEIDVSGNGPPNPEVHGFQIVAVPEPASVFALAGISLYFMRRSPI